MIQVINDIQLSKHFKLSEFICRDNSNKVMLDMNLIYKLQALRDELGKGITVASAYRTKEYNTKIGGSPTSLHLLGMAADIKVSGITPLDVGLAAGKVGFKGIGVYTHNDQYFTHVDVRDYKSYWIDADNHKLIKVDSLIQKILPKYYAIGTTDIAEIHPMDIRASLIYKTGNKVKDNNFVNGAYCWYKPQDNKHYTIGWLISGGYVLNGYDVDVMLNGKPRKKGSFLIYKDGKVEAKNMTNLDIKAIADKLWFCIQGFNLFPLDLIGEGYNPDEVARATWRPAIGYDPVQDRVVIAIRPDTDADRISQTMINLKCSCGIGLDAGSTCNARFGGKDIHITDSLLTNIIYW